MFKHKHYVPVLKGKRAEFPALAALRSKTRITPLFEAVPSAPPDEIPRRLDGKWPNSSPYLIDLVFLDDPDDTAVPASPDHPLRRCFATVDDRGQAAIPVTAPSRSRGYQDAARQIVSESDTGLALRLSADDFEDDSDGLEELLAAPTESSRLLGAILIYCWTPAQSQAVPLELSLRFTARTSTLFRILANGAVSPCSRALFR